jgi:hypothetical protein
LNKPQIKKLVLFSLIPVLVYFSYIAACRGLADVYHHKIKNQVSKWQKTGKGPDLELWNKTAGTVESAISLSPNDSDLLLTAGWFYEWKPAEGSSDKQKALETAMGYYRRSIMLRPAWPLGWSELAHAKYNAVQFDSEFQDAFYNAIELGPWEPEILFGMSELGYAAYPHLTKQNRMLFLESTRRAVQQKPKQLFEMAKRYGYTSLYCYVAAGNKRAMKYCKRSWKL